jgi:hypothetical protein
MSEYNFIFLVILFAIIAMILFMYIGDVESQVDELEKFVFDLERLDIEQNMIGFVDEAIKTLGEQIESEE